jgi:hypothetical protein
MSLHACGERTISGHHADLFTTRDQHCDLIDDRVVSLGWSVHDLD